MRPISAGRETPASAALGDVGGIGGSTGANLEAKPQSDLNLLASTERIHTRSHAHTVYVVSRSRGPVVGDRFRPQPPEGSLAPCDATRICRSVGEQHRRSAHQHRDKQSQCSQE